MRLYFMVSEVEYDCSRSLSHEGTGGIKAIGPGWIEIGREEGWRAAGFFRPKGTYRPNPFLLSCR